MSDELPQLDPIEHRKVELRWQQLIELYKFNGEHLRWPDSLEKRSQWVRRFTGPIPSPRWAVHHKDQDQIEPDDIRIVELIGWEETALLAVGLLDILMKAYFAQWAASGKPFEEFVSWIPALEERVITHLRSLWNGRGDWFDRAALPLVKAKISGCTSTWRKLARDMELARLNQPPLETAASVIAESRRVLAEWQDAKELLATAPVPSEAADQAPESPAATTDPGDLFGVVRQLPPDDPLQKVITEFFSKSREALADFNAKFADEADPRHAIEFAVSQFAFACELALETVHDIESAQEFEAAFTGVVDGYLNWFMDWCKSAVSDEPDRVARELFPELNRRLLKVLSQMQARAWASIRSRPEAHIPLGATPDSADSPPPDPLTTVGQSATSELPAGAAYGFLTEADEKADRVRVRDAYRSAWKDVRVKVSHESIAKKVSPGKWHTGDPIDKWLQLDPRYNGKWDRRIRAVLAERPKKS